MALLARFGACKWDMADGHTDYLQGQPALDGQALRAVADSGFGSSAGNTMEMLNWVNRDKAHSAHGAPMGVPVMRSLGGQRASEHGPDTWGLWCKKSVSVPGVQAQPRNRVPFDLEDAHFVVVALSVPLATSTGVVFQASRAEGRQCSEMALFRGQPQLRFVDAHGQTVQLRSPLRLAPHLPVVLTLSCTAGLQPLRVNAQVVARSAATFAPSVFSQLLIGWGFLSHAPVDGFTGHVFSVVAGPGAPSAAELAVIERQMGRSAGLDLGA
jgi:hypothetical protein